MSIYSRFTNFLLTNKIMRDLLSHLTLLNLKGSKILVLLFFGSFTLVYGQNITVSGVVSDVNGMTIPGVNVSVKGSQGGTVTDYEGKYTLNSPSNGTLTYSFIGFKTQEIQVKGSETINVVLLENVDDLSEVVVIGYGSQNKKDVNSAISSIKSSDIQDLKQVSIDQMLQGKLAGVTVTNGSGQPGAAVSVRVRGTTSINGTNEPLYIVDGVPISGDATSAASSGRPLSGNDFSSGGGSGNSAVSPLSFLNPNDIESVDVLKDASATAIYGSRGANGVIIITTKSGKKNKGKITYDYFTAVSSIYRKLDVLNLSDYAKHQNALSDIFELPKRAEFAFPELLGQGTNWQDEIYQTAVSKNHQLSFSGGSNLTNYYLSGGFLDQESNIIGSGYKRYTFRFNLDSKIKDWLKVGSNISTGITNENITINQSFLGLISNTLLQAPDMPVTNIDGTYAAPPEGQNVNYFNPVAEALTRENKLIRKNFLGNVFLEADIIKGLKYRVELSANTEFSENTEFSPSFDRGSQFNLTADLNERRQNWYTTNIKNLLSYDFSYNSKHKVTLLAGQEALDSHWEGILASAQGFKTNDIYGLNLSDPDGRFVTSYKGSQSLFSLFGRAIYDYDNKYSFSASYRGDQSSKFDPTTKNQWGYFPAVALAWRLSNEAFMKGTEKYVDNIKLRIGYGETGNQQIPNNRYSALLIPQSDSFLVANSPNPNLTWESLKQTNFGLDFSLFDSRLGINLDYYIKKSDGFLFQVPLPDYLTGGSSFYGGIDAPYSNLGEMQNIGYDITIGYSNKAGNNLSWNSSLVISHYKNELLSIQDGLPLTQEVNTNGFQPVVVTNTLVGQPIGVFYGYLTDGIFIDTATLNNAPIQFGQSVGTAPGQTYLGDVKYVDLNGDGVIDENDKTVIGNPHPDFTFGFTNNFKYKNFDLSIFLQGSVGNDIMNLTRRSGTANSSLFVNQLQDASNFWTPENPSSNIPRPINSLGNRNLEISDRYVEDGSYLRVQNFTFGYNLPSKLLQKTKLTRLRFYMSAQNLLTFTKYSGYDPEIGSFNQNILLSGIDNGRFPTPRTYSIGINLEF
jgi:TonB-linked SusC/RagA family outer membrane protein